ncbi:hypothetical protein J0683_24925, partial [Vibrio parahaemolyticus]|nr:hypothetical protein [Vibrio parahaemolyticus]
MVDLDTIGGLRALPRTEPPLCNDPPCGATALPNPIPLPPNVPVESPAELLLLPTPPLPIELAVASRASTSICGFPAA